MSTIQKAFVFVVVVLAVLTAAVTLVLFAQRVNWRATATTAEDNLKKTKAEVDALKKQLAADKEAHVAEIATRDSRIGALSTELESTKRDLELIRDDKARQEALASKLEASFQILSNNNEAYFQRNKELEVAKQTAETRLEEARSAAMAAEENLAIAKRQSTDLAGQVRGLTEQLAARTEEIDQLKNRVAVLETYAPPVGAVPTAATKEAVYGKVTGLSKDGQIVFLSIGSDDGVQKGMTFIIYKPQGHFVANAKVYDVSPDKSAAKIIKPIYGTIAEGDNVTN